MLSRSTEGGYGKLGSFGQLVVCIAALLSAAGGALVLSSTHRPGFLSAGRKMLHGASSAAAISLLVLVYLLLTHDYRLSYIRDYADQTMSTGYLVMAIWGGQEGSLLLWAVLQTWLTSLVAIFFQGEKNRNLLPVALGFLACIQVFFYCLVLFHSNPFEPLGTIASKGVGLNPLLRNPYMAIHPPTLYLGFVGFSVPVAFVFAALLDKVDNDQWIEDLRPWILVAWVFLSIGNILGMVWAYEELGWGGYWGWDPVENASFIPWLTGTALLHSVLILKRKRVFRVWILVLSVLTFLLVIFGTFLTRSGVIASVHAFSGATTGPYLLGLIAFVGTAFIALIVWRRRFLSTPSSDHGLLSPINLFLLANIAFVLSAAFVWFATMAPLFTEVLFGEKVAVTPEFFNRWMVPFGLILLGLLLVCVVVGWRLTDLGRLGRRIFGPFVAACVAGSMTALLVGVNAGASGFRRYLPILAAALVAAAAVGVGRTAFGLVKSSFKHGGFPGNGRQRFGGQLVHLSVVLLFFGFLGSAYTSEETGSLFPGQTMRVGDYHLKFLGLWEDNNYERKALLADIAVVREDEAIGVLSPSRHLYHSHPGQPTSEVVIRTTWKEDLFLILGEGDGNSGTAVLRALVNPLVVWIWVGGFLLVIGTIIAMIPNELSNISSRLLGSKETRARLFPIISGLAIVIVIPVGFGVIRDVAASMLALMALGLVANILLFGSALTDLARELGETE